MEKLIEFSRRYGGDPTLVIAGGGNTSMKENGVLYVKRSGAALASVGAEDFAALDISRLLEIPKKKYPGDDASREAEYLSDILAARLPGSEDKRPSVETLLHALFPQRYAAHLHPTMANGLTCSLQGEAAAARLFPEAVWVPECRPGYTLAMLLESRIDAGTKLVLMQNHGVFIAADTAEELDCLLRDMQSRLSAEIERAYDPARFSPAELSKPFTPDHLVFCGVGPELPAGENARLLWADAQKIAKYAASFGGCHPMSSDLVDFILHWEAERYRRSQA